jgi:hypothetical protein
MADSLSLWERESARSRQRKMLAHTPVGAVRSLDHGLCDMLAACPHFKAVAR